MKTEKENYNGWTNYETWNVKLWIDNDQGSHEYWLDRACNWLAISQKTDIFTKEENASFDFREELKDYFEEGAQNLLEASKMQASCFSDLLGSALSNVNWQEIAESLLEEITNN